MGGGTDHTHQGEASSSADLCLGRMPRSVTAWSLQLLFSLRAHASCQPAHRRLEARPNVFRHVTPVSLTRSSRCACDSSCLVANAPAALLCPHARSRTTWGTGCE